VNTTPTSTSNCWSSRRACTSAASTARTTPVVGAQVRDETDQAGDDADQQAQLEAHQRQADA
jgi:hypothetical protein